MDRMVYIPLQRPWHLFFHKDAYNRFDWAVNPTTEIRYALAQEAEAELAVFDALAQKVKTRVQGPMRPGHSAVVWDGSNQTRQPVGSGIYFYRLSWDPYQETKKMILLR